MNYELLLAVISIALAYLAGRKQNSTEYKRIMDLTKFYQQQYVSLQELNLAYTNQILEKSQVRYAPQTMQEEQEPTDSEQDTFNFPPTMTG